MDPWKTPCLIICNFKQILFRYLFLDLDIKLSKCALFQCTAAYLLSKMLTMYYLLPPKLLKEKISKFRL